MTWLLEEVAIEAELRKEYKAGDLRYVTSRDARNAAWYIESSADKAKEFYQGEDGFIDLITPFYRQALNTGHASATELAQIYSTYQMRINEVNRLVSENPLRRQDRMELVAELASANGDEEQSAILKGHAPCGHEDESENLRERLHALAPRE